MALVSGNLTGVAIGSVYTPLVYLAPNSTSANLVQPVPVQFNIQVTGTFAATWQIIRSIDGGKTFSPISSMGQPYSFTGTMNESFTEVMQGVQYAIQVTNYTSGTLNYVFGP